MPKYDKTNINAEGERSGGGVRPKHPQPVAYCWLEGREMSKRMIKHKGCDDPEKQIDGQCKWLQWYGERVKPILIEREEGD